MKIEREDRAEVRLQDFADQHNLTMLVTEYASPPREFRFAARFKGAEVGGNGVLTGTYGDGHTELDAIADYAKQIGKVILVIDAYTSTRREIYTPVFHPYKPDA